MELKYAKDTSKTNEDIEYKFGVWYPIESAPKDGTEILIFYEEDSMECGSYHGLREWEDSHFHRIRNATHWMPLPPNP